MKNALIIGATGFGGLGLIEILLRHKGFNIKQLIARRDTGKPISEIFPHLKGFCDNIIQTPEDIDYNDIDIVFYATPDRTCMETASNFLNKKIPVIDFSGDFRFNTVKDYKNYAEKRGVETNHLSPDLLDRAVYGVPELYFDRIKNAGLVGNPGCFAVSMILGLMPAIQSEMILSDTIICDSKTGVSGAGKYSGESNLYPQRYENINTYREGAHQHAVEVENTINLNNKNKKNILLIPQIVPMNRGILTTIYADIDNSCSTEKLLELYENFYSDKPFVIVSDSSPNTSEVRGSNICVIRPMADKRTGKLIIVSVIDNLLKGQSGNAVQNANIMMGYNETEGLNMSPFYP